MAQLIVIDDVSLLPQLKAEIATADYVAFDIETTGLTQRDEVIGYSICTSEEQATYVILAKWDVEKNCLIYLEDLKKASIDILNSLKSKSLVCHNGIFDCSMVESYFKIRLIERLHTDTMVLAHLLDENRRIGLKELASSMFGEDSTEEQKQMKESVAKNGGLLTKADYQMYKADPYLLGKYGAKDALLTYKIFLNLVPELYEQQLDKFFYEDESMPLLRGPTYELNTTGLQVDTKALLSLKKTLEAECLEAKDYIYQEITPYIKEKYPNTTKKNGFNIGSSSQLAWLLFGKLNLDFGNLTDEGKAVCRKMGLKLPYTFSARRDFIAECERTKGSIYQPEVKNMQGAVIARAKKIKEPWSYITTDKKILTKLAPKYKWIEKLLEYQRKQKILNTYVTGIEERTQYGIIHPSFLQIGTTSGRYSSKNPNFQNLPRDDKRIKECIVARPGKVFVGADYSQLEPRVFAYISGDTKLMEAFNGDADFYSVIGMKVYGKFDCTPQKEGSPDAFGIKYKKLRDLSKVIALASTYGATAHQLAPTTGKSIEDTQEDIDNYFEEFPLVAKMMTDSHAEAKTNGRVVNIFGRPRRMPEAKRIVKLYGNIQHSDLPYEARSLLNLAVNHRIQSTGASIVNRAAIKLYNDCKEAGIDAKIVTQVHDSIIMECDAQDAETISLLLQNAMESTTQLDGIALEASPKIGKNLSEV